MPFLLDARDVTTVLISNEVTNSGFEFSLKCFSISSNIGPPAKKFSEFSSNLRPVEAGICNDDKNWAFDAIPEIYKFPGIVAPNNFTKFKLLTKHSNLKMKGNFRPHLFKKTYLNFHNLSFQRVSVELRQ